MNNWVLYRSTVAMYVHVNIACHSIQAHTNRHTDTYVVLTEMGYTSCKQTDRQTDRQTHTHTVMQMEHTASKTDRCTDRQTW